MNDFRDDYRNVFKAKLIMSLSLQVNFILVLILAEYYGVQKYVTNIIVVTILIVYIVLYMQINKVTKKNKYYGDRYSKYIVNIITPMLLICISNILVYNLEVSKSPYIEQIKLALVKKEDTLFKGIYVIPERPSSTLSTDKVTIESYSKTINEMKVSPKDLYRTNQNNLSPYIKK